MTQLFSSMQFKASRPVVIGVAGALVLAVILFVVLRGSDSSDSPQAIGGAAYAGPVAEGEGQISVLAWPGYIENGSTDPKIDWITGFEKETGCKVSVRTFGTPEQAVDLFKSDEFDVVAAPGITTLQLIKDGRLQPLNTELLINWADIFEDLRTQAANDVEGLTFGAPQGRVANVLMYRTDVIDPAPETWAEVWNANSAYAGRISAYDSPITIADAALYLMSTQPDLLITDPYSLDEKQFQAAVDLLTAQSANVGLYWSDYAAQLQAFKAGEVVLGSTWQVIVNLAKAEGAPLNAVMPQEGTTGWSDSWSIRKDTPNINCAYLFVDHMISPIVNASVAEWFGQAPSNSKACDVTTNAKHCATYRASDAEFWSQVQYWTAPTEKCRDERTDVACVPYEDWIKAWNSQVRVQ